MKLSIVEGFSSYVNRRVVKPVRTSAAEFMTGSLKDFNQIIDYKIETLQIRTVSECYIIDNNCRSFIVDLAKQHITVSE